MAPRRKGKAKKLTERQKKLESLVEQMDAIIEQNVKQMENDVEEICQSIDSQYENGLLQIDARFHDMTLEQIMASQSETPKKQIEQLTSVANIGNRFKCMSEKKVMLSASRTASRSVLSTQKKTIDPNLNADTVKKPMSLKRKRKILGSMQYTTTPLFKKKIVSNTPVTKTTNKPGRRAITPKFDPRTPLPNGLLRKPRAGEVIMSVTGSPVQNCAPESPFEKPGILLSLGQGRVLDMNDKSQFENMNGLDAEAKRNIKLALEKLSGLVKR